VAETQLTIRGVEAMVRTEGDVIFDISNVDLTDEVGIGALCDLIDAIHRHDGTAHFLGETDEARLVDQIAIAMPLFEV
jgi:anti-anti-sigma regulatory factor